MHVSWMVGVERWLGNEKGPLNSQCAWRLHYGQALSLTLDMNTKGVFIYVISLQPYERGATAIPSAISSAIRG